MNRPLSHGANRLQQLHICRRMLSQTRHAVQRDAYERRAFDSKVEREEFVCAMKVFYKHISLYTEPAIVADNLSCAFPKQYKTVFIAAWVAR